MSRGLITHDESATASGPPRVVVFARRGRAHAWLQRVGNHLALTSDPERATIFSEARATELASIWGGDVREPPHPRDERGQFKGSDK